MTTVRIETNLEQVAKALSFIGSGVREKVLRISLNTAMDRGFTVAKREIGKQANITLKDIAAGMQKIPASAGNLSAAIVNRNHWQPASYRLFKARQDARGSAFTPWVGHREAIAHGFIRRMGTGHESIFKRVGKARFPIADVGWGPNPAPEMVREDHDARVPTAIGVVVQATLTTELPRQFDRLVGEAKGKFGV